MVRITSYRGIDYRAGARMSDGRLVNQDEVTLVHYGVIGQNAEGLNVDWDFDTESVFLPSCPSCGTPLEDSWLDGEDGICPSCEEELTEDDVYGDEPSYTILTGDYEGTLDSQGDFMITQSPWFTRCQFCSPCAPGAGHLEAYCEDGVRTYCFGPEMWEGEKAPYPVWSVASGECVFCPEGFDVTRFAKGGAKA